MIVKALNIPSGRISFPMNRWHGFDHILWNFHNFIVQLKSVIMSFGESFSSLTNSQQPTANNYQPRIITNWCLLFKLMTSIELKSNFEIKKFKRKNQNEIQLMANGKLSSLKCIESVAFDFMISKIAILSFDLILFDNIWIEFHSIII